MTAHEDVNNLTYNLQLFFYFTIKIFTKNHKHQVEQPSQLIQHIEYITRVTNPTAQDAINTLNYLLFVPSGLRQI